MSKLILNYIHNNDRKHYLPYLLMADEEEIISGYINEGKLYLIHIGKELVGIALFIMIDIDTVELKNFAIVPEYRGKGIGKEVIPSFFKLFKEKNVKQMIVGTANCSIANIAFYQKAGFRMERVEKGFFLKYPSPIYENGIRASDMIVFKKEF